MLISDHERTVTLVLTKESQPWKGDSGFQTDWKHWIYKVKVPSQLLSFKRISVFNRMVPIPPTWTILTAWESNFTLNRQKLLKRENWFWIFPFSRYLKWINFEITILKWISWSSHVMIRKLIYKWYAYGSAMLFRTGHHHWAIFNKMLNSCCYWISTDNTV